MVIRRRALAAQRPNNLAARMGRWSAHHRKLAIFGWLGFVVVAFAIGNVVGTKNIDQDRSGPGESGRMMRILDDDFKTPASETILVEHEKLTTDDAGFKATLADVVRRVRSEPAVTNVRSPLDDRYPGQIAPDRHAAIVEFDIRGDSKKAKDKIGPVLDRVENLQTAHPGYFVGEFGDASSEKQIDDAFVKDLDKAGYLSLPLTLGILVLAFGALVAAGIPVLLALTAVMATLGLLSLPSQLLPVDQSIFAIILLIGLAVGVDYSLFYLKREREERAAGRSEEAALEAAAATSGRAVLISGFTVMAAMAGMFLTGDKTFSSFALATMMVVAVAVLGSLTVLPALLSKLGDNVDRLRVPLIGRFTNRREGGRLWSAIVDRVLRYPVISLALAGGFLLALAVPTLQMHTAIPGPETFSQSIPVMKTYNRLQKVFPGDQIPAEVVVKAPNVRDPKVADAMGTIEWRALETHLMYEPITTFVNREGTVARLSVPVAGKGTDDKSYAALAKLREEIVPQTVGRLPDVEAGVAGTTALSKDFNDQMKSAAPYVFAFVLALAFMLLLLAFRSIVIAAKAIILNLLSVAAAYGVLVLVFQYGWGKGLLGFDYTGGIISWLPIFLFVILFGLSMDYHVFILSRVRERYDHGESTEAAISHGIKTTAGVVTSAALVMVGVFGIFGTLSMIFFKQFGVGLAVAVLLDATIVRAVLLPASMKLLGDWNWYLPKWLEWLPQLERERGPVPETPALRPSGR
jgi:uncharacterized membrane protein YdfJ with MMPL/SSD domain